MCENGSSHVLLVSTEWGSSCETQLGCPKRMKLEL